MRKRRTTPSTAFVKRSMTRTASCLPATCASRTAMRPGPFGVAADLDFPGLHQVRAVVPPDLRWPARGPDRARRPVHLSSLRRECVHVGLVCSSPKTMLTISCIVSDRRAHDVEDQVPDGGLLQVGRCRPHKVRPAPGKRSRHCPDTLTYEPSDTVQRHAARRTSSASSTTLASRADIWKHRRPTLSPHQGLASRMPTFRAVCPSRSRHRTSPGGGSLIGRPSFSGRSRRLKAISACWPSG
jgi:hypothetical protein